MPATASSYCAARARLPLALFAQRFDAVVHHHHHQHQQLQPQPQPHATATLLNGRRAVLADVVCSLTT